MNNFLICPLTGLKTDTDDFFHRTEKSYCIKLNEENFFFRLCSCFDRASYEELDSESKKIVLHSLVTKMWRPNKKIHVKDQEWHNKEEDTSISQILETLNEIIRVPKTDDDFLNLILQKLVEKSSTRGRKIKIKDDIGFLAEYFLDTFEELDYYIQELKERQYIKILKSVNGQAKDWADLHSITIQVRTDGFKYVESLNNEIEKNHKKTVNERKSVFVCYSRHDIKYLGKIETHFAPLKSNIELWNDSKINPGDKWEEEILKAMEKADAAIFLLSADFFASHYVQEKELPKLLAAAENKGVKIFPVFISPCLIEEFKSINQYQFVNDPKKAISGLMYHEQEKVWKQLAVSVRDYIGSRGERAQNN